MRVALVEDELPALDHLAVMLQRVEPRAEVVARLRTVRQTRAWLVDGEAELIVADIQLGDGLSLDAFEDSPRTIPIVFATAHDHYLAEALAGNGIAYLLKPLRDDDLAAAIAKLHRLERHFIGTLGALAWSVRPRERLVGRRGRDWVGLPVDALAYVQVRTDGVIATDHAGQEILLDEALSSLQTRLDPARFHRVNRQTLVAIDAIARVRAEGRGRLSLQLLPPSDLPVEVAQEGAAAFRQWFGMRSRR